MFLSRRRHPSVIFTDDTSPAGRPPSVREATLSHITSAITLKPQKRRSARIPYASERKVPHAKAYGTFLAEDKGFPLLRFPNQPSRAVVRSASSTAAPRRRGLCSLEAVRYDRSRIAPPLLLSPKRGAFRGPRFCRCFVRRTRSVTTLPPPERRSG